MRKYQASSIKHHWEKLQAPTSNIQTNSNLQAPITSLLKAFEIWCLALVWMLVLGGWCFRNSEGLR